MPFCTCILSDREREYRVGKKEESERERELLSMDIKFPTSYTGEYDTANKPVA